MFEEMIGWEVAYQRGHNSAVATAKAATTEGGTTNIVGRAASSQAHSEGDRTGRASSVVDIVPGADYFETRNPTHSQAITSVEVHLNAPFE